MNKILIITLSVLMFTDVFAKAFNVRQETLKEDKDTLMNVLKKGQCGSICVRYERNRTKRNGILNNAELFSFCRVSVIVCKD